MAVKNHLDKSSLSTIISPIYQTKGLSYKVHLSLPDVTLLHPAIAKSSNIFIKPLSVFFLTLAAELLFTQ